MKLKPIVAVRFMPVLICTMCLLIVHTPVLLIVDASLTQDPNATLPSTKKSTPSKTTSPKPRKTSTPSKSSRPQAKSTTSSNQNRSNPPVTASALATRAKDYLVNTRGIDAGRIVTVDGGYLDEPTVELWIVPAGATPPHARGKSFSNHSAITSAQVGQLSGEVTIRQPNGATTPVAGASIDVYRTDIPGRYQTRTDRNGRFVFAGLPFAGTYVIAVSAPNASPNALGGVKAGRDINYKITLSPGDGRRFTETEAIAAASSVGSNDAARPAQQCPRIEMSCPTAIKEGQSATFSANVLSGNSNVNLAYNWSVSAGTITSGQGTLGITVDTSSTGGQTITATVEVGRVDRSCNPTASCTTTVESIPVARKFDEFGNINSEDEKGRLDNFAIQLEQEPSTLGYIIAYARRRR